MNKNPYLIILLLLVAHVLCNANENMFRPRRLGATDDLGCLGSTMSMAKSCGELTAASIATEGLGAIVLGELRRECLLDLIGWSLDCKDQIAEGARSAIQAYCKAFPSRCDAKDPCAQSGGILHGAGQSPPCAGCMRTQGSNMCWYCETSKSYAENCKCPRHCEWGCDKVTGKCGACERYWWGATCDNRCGEHCELGCHKETGECGNCDRYWWGPTCANKCPKHCELGCDKKTGECGACDRGWWGPTCDNKCGEHCQWGCDKATGLCGDCDRGWWGPRCSNECGKHCAFGCDKNTGACGLCDRDWWGTTCGNKCGVHCAFGCNKDTGECGYCDRDWWGTTCGNKCPGNCSFGCNKVTGAC